MPDDDTVMIERRRELDEAALMRRRARRSGDLAGKVTASLNVSARGTRRLASPSQSRRDKAIAAGAVDLSDDGEDEGAAEDDMIDLEASGTTSAPVSPDESRRRRDRQRQLHRTQRLLASVAQKSSHDQRRDRDNMTEFIEKKRQVFYTQMALDVKNGELQKLKKQSDDRIDWIRKMELLLEEDTVRFDTFFKENHSATKEAIQRSELMTAKKREKMSAIKHTMQHVQLEMTQIEKLRASVGECLRCVRPPSHARACVADMRLQALRFASTNAGGLMGVPCDGTAPRAVNVCAALHRVRWKRFARALTPALHPSPSPAYRTATNSSSTNLPRSGILRSRGLLLSSTRGCERLSASSLRRQAFPRRLRAAWARQALRRRRRRVRRRERKWRSGEHRRSTRRRVAAWRSLRSIA